MGLCVVSGGVVVVFRNNQVNDTGSLGAGDESSTVWCSLVSSCLVSSRVCESWGVERGAWPVKLEPYAVSAQPSTSWRRLK